MCSGRHPPQLFQLMQCADADYICLGDKYVLTRIGKDALSQERAANIIADYNAEAAKVLAGPAAQQESEGRGNILQFNFALDALLKFCLEHGGTLKSHKQFHVLMNEVQKEALTLGLRRQAEPAPTPSLREREAFVEKMIAHHEVGAPPFPYETQEPCPRRHDLGPETSNWARVPMPCTLLDGHDGDCVVRWNNRTWKCTPGGVDAPNYHFPEEIHA
jgi:hypothetical protein